MKKAVRIIIAAVFLIPSIPLFWLATSLFGIGFLLSIFGIIGNWIGWLFNKDPEEMDDDAPYFLKFFIMSPFIFWWAFVQGDKETLQQFGL